MVQSWDTATRPSELNSYCVCTTWGINGKDYYLVDVRRQRLNYTGLKRAVKQHAQAFDADVILIEDRSSGTQLIEDLIAEGVQGVTRYVPKGSKIMRLHAQTTVIENGFVYLPRKAAWLPDFLHEITTFPDLTHSDQVDSVSQFLDWVRRCRHPAWAWIEAQRQLISMEGGAPVTPGGGLPLGWSFSNVKKNDRLITLRPPRRGTHQTRVGTCYHSDKNGLIHVTAQDSEYFLESGRYKRVNPNDPPPLSGAPDGWPKSPYSR